MNKKALVIGTVGLTAGVLSAFEVNRRRQKRSPLGKETSGASQNSEVADDRTEASASMAKIENGEPSIGGGADHPIDDQGTDQTEAVQILKQIRDNAFGGSNEKLALAMGRPAEEINEWTNGIGTIDGDALMKARSLALQRNVEIENENRPN